MNNIGSFLLTGVQQAKRAQRKRINLARYQRRFARHKPLLKSNRYPAVLILTPWQKRNLPLREGIAYLQQIVRMRFGQPGSWGHGKYETPTRKGPGRRPIEKVKRVKPAGSKLWRKALGKFAEEDSTRTGE